jgi:hypothetical protein
MASDRPIIFSAPMVLALLAGRKTQTRRLAKRHVVRKMPGGFYQDFIDQPSPWLKVAPGDRLWVRENAVAEEQYDVAGVFYHADGGWQPIANCEAAAEAWFRMHTYGVTDPLNGGRIVPSIHMPRWASRLTLTVTDVRVQRLQDISEEDAAAEGVPAFQEVGRTHPDPHRLNFRLTWDSLHGAGAWEANPEVVALSFTVERRNIDAAEGGQ